MSAPADFSAWAAEKAELAAEARAAAEQAAAEERVKRDVQSRAAEAAFTRWTIDKAVHDRALAVFPQLAPSRGAGDDEWREVTLALAYTQVYLDERFKELSGDYTTKISNERSLDRAFLSWTRKAHGYDKVTISEALAKRFSKSMQAQLEESSDSPGSFSLLGVSFLVPMRAADAASAKPQPADDKLRNAIFTSATKKAWKSALEDAASALNSEAGADAAKRARIAHERGIDQLERWIELDKIAAKKKADDEAVSKRESGLAYHRKWLERKDAVRVELPPFEPNPPVHENHFKDKIKGHFDCNLTKGKSFHRTQPKTGKAPTALEFIKSLGPSAKNLKFVHAIGEGASADLMRSRAELLAEGHVYLRNFANTETGAIDAEARAAYEQELETNEAIHGRVRRAREKAERDAALFADWVATKEGAELARECMRLLPVTLSTQTQQASTDAPSSEHVDTSCPHAPIPGTLVRGRNSRPSSASGNRRSSSSVPGDGVTPKGGASSAVYSEPLLDREPTEDETVLWRAVGYACRAIDRALLADWSDWSRPLFSRSACFSTWTAFTPPANAAGVGASVTQTTRAARPGSASAHTRGVATSRNSAELGEAWGPAARLSALKLLKVLSGEHRRLAEFRASAALEAPPLLPFFKRVASAEYLPAFLHGTEGAINRVTASLAIPDGMGCTFLGGSGVGAELVLQWWVGEGSADDEDSTSPAAAELSTPPTSSTGTDRDLEDTDALLKRIEASSKKAHSLVPKQPPYAIVLESVGIMGSKRAREGEWKRVVIDPPEPLPILTSAPGTKYLPLSVSGQGLGVLPPDAGQEWPDVPATRLRGAVRLTGLLPNTTYAFRVRAFSRAGSGPFAFGAFTTAAAPPPAPMLALPTYAPRDLLAGDGVGDIAHSSFPVQPDALTLVWDRRVGFRVGLLRLLRAFHKASGGAAARAASSTPFNNSTRGGADNDVEEDGAIVGGRPPVVRRLNSMDSDGIRNADGDDGVMDEDDDTFSATSRGRARQTIRRGTPPGGLFGSVSVSRHSLLSAINAEVGLRNWLAACVASVDLWAVREGEPMEGQPLHVVLARSAVESAGSFGVAAAMRTPAAFKVATTRPVSVLEALVRDSAAPGGLTWAGLVAHFSTDAEAENTTDLLLAGVPPPPPPPVHDATAAAHVHAHVTDAQATTDAVLHALSVRSVGGTTQGAGTRPPSAGAASPGRKAFVSYGGLVAVTSQAKAGLRSLHSRLSRSVLFTSNASMMAANSSAAAGGTSLRAASASATVRARPHRALGASTTLMGVNASESLTAVAYAGDGGQNQQPSFTAISSVTPAPTPAATRALAVSYAAIRDASLKYSLVECSSDGRRGQHWNEVFVGVRAVRVVDKRLPGTTYSFKVQAVNADGQSSLFSPQSYVTTALPAPTNVRSVGRAAATSVTVAWDAVSSANALTTARLLNQAPPDTASPKESPGGTSKSFPAASVDGADIDAILEALLARTKNFATSTVADKQAAMATTPPPREGDGGMGVDLQRPWARYDTEGTGSIPVSSLRGLLADLGAYAETAALVLGATDPTMGVVSSGEGAASVGMHDWRLAACIESLDPNSRGVIHFTDFSNWWNAVDAALEKARLVKAGGSAAGTPSRPSSSASSRRGLPGAVVGGATGIAGDPSNLGAAVIYVLECRRAISPDELASVANAVVATAQQGGMPEGGASGRASTFDGGSPSPMPTPGGSRGATRPSSARSVLSAPVVACSVIGGDGVNDLEGAVTEAAALFGARGALGTMGRGSSASSGHTPWAVVYMGSDTRFTLSDLLPNGHYQFRVSAIGRHAFSQPCKTLSVALSPLAPFAPVIVRTASRSVVLRAYLGELGADKVEVQMKIVEALISPHNRNGSNALHQRENDGTVYAGRNVMEVATRRLATSRVALRPGKGTTADTALSIMSVGGDEPNPLWTEDADMQGHTHGETIPAPGGAVAVASPTVGGAWSTVYTGMSLHLSITGLLPNTVYRVRLVCYSSSGVPSLPSHETQVVTRDNPSLAASTNNNTLSVASAARDFVVECRPAVPLNNAESSGSNSPRLVPFPSTAPTAAALARVQDLVVGDTILWTEDVFVDGSRPADARRGIAPREVPEAHPNALFLCARTVAASILGDSSLRIATGQSLGVNDPLGPTPVGAVAAAMRMQGKLLSSADKAAFAPTSRAPILVGPPGSVGGKPLPPPATIAEALASRSLLLQVEWCTLSLPPPLPAGSQPARVTASAGPTALAAQQQSVYTLPWGSSMRRRAADLARLDVLRMMWEDEQGRWGLGEELASAYDR